jgi:hypothetical protein
MNAFVVSGLVKRLAELAGEIERTHEALHLMVLAGCPRNPAERHSELPLFA